MKNFCMTCDRKTLLKCFLGHLRPPQTQNLITFFLNENAMSGRGKGAIFGPRVTSTHMLGVDALCTKDISSTTAG